MASMHPSRGVPIVAVVAFLVYFLASYCLSFCREMPEELFDSESVVFNPGMHRNSVSDEANRGNSRVSHRSSRLRSECAKIMPTSSMVNISYHQLLVSDSLRTIYCPIPKAGSTLWRRTLGILSGHVDDLTIRHFAEEMSGKQNTSRLVENPSMGVHARGYNQKAGIRPLSNYTQDERQHRLDNYFTFMFVRDPYERLLSAFEDKFHPSGGGMFRFWLSRKAGVAKDNLTFAIFADIYAQDVLDDVWVNAHWNSYYRLCSPCQINYDFIGHMETFYEDADYVIRKGWNITDDVPTQQLFDPNDGPRAERHNKSTKDKMGRYKDLEDSTMSKIRKAYDYDFRIFGYNS